MHMAEQKTERKSGGRPPTGRNADFTVTMKPELRAKFKQHCKVHKLNVSLLFEEWVQELMANPAQPELAESA